MTCILRAVNASKYVSGRGSTRTSWGNIALPRTLAGFGEGEGKRREEEGRDSGEKGKIGSSSKSPG